MPYKYPDDIPDAIKNLPKRAQKIFVDTFNAVYDETKDEDQARRAAWANVKREYKKEGDAWVKKDAEESLNDIFNIKSTSCDFVVQLSEAEFDNETKSVIVTAIREGWSLNKTNGKQRYYTGKAVEDVVELIGKSRKLFVNHKNGERVVEDWAATWEDSWIDIVDNRKEARGKITFTDNPLTSWLFKEAKLHPSEVGLSIRGRGIFRNGSIDGKEAAIIEGMTNLDSVDFVTQPAAGGGVVKTIESRINNLENNIVLYEAIKKLSDRIKELKKREDVYANFYRIFNAFYDFMQDLAFSNEEDDLDKELSNALDELEQELRQAVMDLKDFLNSNSEKTKESNKMTLDDFRKEHPDVFSELSEQLSSIIKNEMNEKIASLQTEVEDLTKKLAESEAKCTETQKKLDEYEKEKKEREKRDFIESKLKEADISDKITQEWKEILFTFEESIIEKLIKDKAETLKNVEGKIKGMNSTDKKQEKKEVNFKEEFFKRG